MFSSFETKFCAPNTLLTFQAIEVLGTIYQPARRNIPESLNIQAVILNVFCTIYKRPPPHFRFSTALLLITA